MRKLILIPIVAVVIIIPVILYVMVIGMGTPSPLVHASYNCEVSLCDCECYPRGQAPTIDEVGAVCANNCKDWFGVQGCSWDGEKCTKLT